MPMNTPKLWRNRLWACALVGHLSLAAMPLADADEPLPPLCTDSAPASEATDCIELGAAVGELGWSWRQKIPPHVRWLPRKDADALCQQTQTTWGQKVDSAIPGGCVFVAPGACTIVTSGPVSPASIGNAVRDCVP